MKLRITDEEKATIRHLYVADKLSCKQIAKKIGRSPASVHSILRGMEVEFRNPHSVKFVRKIGSKYFYDAGVKAEIIRLYTEEMLGLEEIGKRFSKSKDAIANLLRRNEVAIRTPKESQKARYVTRGVKSIIHFDQPHLQAAFEACVAKVRRERAAAQEASR